MTKSLSSIINSEKKVKLSFYLIEESDKTGTTGTKNNERNERKKLVVTVTISQEHLRAMFSADSIVHMALDAKMQDLERYRSWNILQQDEPKERTNGTAGVRLSDDMKKYHDLPLSIPADQYTEAAIRITAALLACSNEKTRNAISASITKEDCMEAIALCNYLRVKGCCANVG